MKNRFRRIFFRISFLLKRKEFVLFVLFLLFLGLSSHPAYALDFPSPEELAVGIVSWAVNLYVYVMGAFLTAVLIPILIGIAQFNEFINNPVVEIGWTLTRDVANMMFIIVLLIIAFSTMLRIQTYHYKQSLVKLIIMAVLINFSKLISGVIIDFFQVLMLTFVRGFQGALGGNVIQAFRIYDMLALAEGTGAAQGQDLNTLAIIAGLVLAAAGLTVVVFTVMIMILVLLYRVIMLWLLVVLSPLAYFAYTIRPNYWSQWWSEFFKQLTTGPVIAFFLWLELKVAQDIGAGTLLKGAVIQQGDTVGNTTNPFASGFATPDIFINYLTMIALMIGGLVVSQKMASQTGGAVGSAAGKIARGRPFITAGRMGLKAGKVGGKVALGTAAFAGGVALNKLSQGGSKTWRGRIRKNVIDRAAASKIPVLNRLATGLHKNLNQRKKALGEKAQEYVGGIKDRRIIERLAKQKGAPVRTSKGEAIINAASTKSPSALFDRNNREASRDSIIGKLEDMSPEELGKLSKGEWARLGNLHAAGDIDLRESSSALEYIQKNGAVRGAVNEAVNRYEGLNLDHTNFNDILNRSNRAIGGLGAQSNNAGQRFTRFDDYVDSPGVFTHRYRDVDEKDKDKPQGEGNLAINQFAEKGSSVVAASFDDLGGEIEKVIKKGDIKDKNGNPLKQFLKREGEEYKHKAGVNITDQGQIKATAQAMSNHLKSQIKSEQDEDKKAKLQQAKARFDRIASGEEEVDSLSLVNSSAAGYNGDELKKTLTHERLHRLGIKDEKTVETATQAVLDNKIYSYLEQIAEGIKEGMSVNDVVAAVNASRGHSVAEPATNYKQTVDILQKDAQELSNMEDPEAKSEAKELTKMLHFADSSNVGLEQLAGYINQRKESAQQIFDDKKVAEADKMLRAIEQEKHRRANIDVSKEKGSAPLPPAAQEQVKEVVDAQPKTVEDLQTLQGPLEKIASTLENISGGQGAVVSSLQDLLSLTEQMVHTKEQSTPLEVATGMASVNKIIKGLKQSNPASNASKDKTASILQGVAYSSRQTAKGVQQLKHKSNHNTGKSSNKNEQSK